MGGVCDLDSCNGLYNTRWLRAIIFYGRICYSLKRWVSMQEHEIILYQLEDTNVYVNVIFKEETFWMTQRAMAELFDCTADNISLHLKNIYKEEELDVEATAEFFSVVQNEGGRNVSRKVKCFNLDAIIAVGYRVNSKKATKFRQWATKTLKEYIIKGFVLNDDMLKNGKPFGKDYFDELLERIREIRASERRYYQKITDVYAECSADYDPKSETTQLFFKMVQNMMHWAVTHQTAAEIVYSRADAKMPHMGLTTWKNAPDGRVQKSDTIVAKNYLSDKEASALNHLSTAFLDFAELRAERQIITTMADWKKQLDEFLALYKYDTLNNAGTISAEQAKEKAYAEYDKFRLIQDKEYLSDFDKEIKVWKEKGLFGED